MDKERLQYALREPEPLPLPIGRSWPTRPAADAPRGLRIVEAWRILAGEERGT